MSESSSDPNVPDRPEPRPSNDVGSDPTEHLRDELRLGVRMIEALENQMKRAENLVRLGEDVSQALDDLSLIHI